MNINFNPPGQPPKGPLAKVLTWILGALLLGAALMFSLVFFAVVAVTGLILGVYFWWKTRAIRAQIRAQMQAQAEAAENSPGYAASQATPEATGEIIEGVAVRVVEEREQLPR